MSPDESNENAIREGEPPISLRKVPAHRPPSKVTQVVLGIAGAVLGGFVAYGICLLIGKWLESSNPVARGHAIDFSALFLWFIFQIYTDYCCVPMGVILGGFFGAAYLAPRIQRS